jgi:hypothetical protein
MKNLYVKWADLFSCSVSSSALIRMCPNEYGRAHTEHLTLPITTTATSACLHRLVCHCKHVSCVACGLDVGAFLPR